MTSLARITRGRCRNQFPGIVSKPFSWAAWSALAHPVARSRRITMGILCIQRPVQGIFQNVLLDLSEIFSFANDVLVVAPLPQGDTFSLQAFVDLNGGNRFEGSHYVW